MVELVTAEEYAKRSSMDVQSVRRMCRQGRLKCQKIGAHWRVAVPKDGYEERLLETAEAVSRVLEGSVEEAERTAEAAVEAVRTATEKIEAAQAVAEQLRGMLEEMKGQQR